VSHHGRRNVSLARKAVRGAVWTIVLSLGSRIVGALTTIAIARYLTPSVDGEVQAAWVIVLVGSMATRFGFDQYLLVKQHDGDDVPFHCTFYMVLLGILSLGLVWLFGGFFADLSNAPGASALIPLAVVGVGLRRVASVPQRILVRDFRFRTAAVAEAVGELAYSASALWLARAGHGGYSIVIANIIQGAVLLGIVFAAVGWRSWLLPYRLSWQRTRDMFRFGTPLNFHALLYYVAHYCDRLAVSAAFGVHPMGLYSKAYSLADIPASHVGEHIGSVLLPSMHKIEPERRIDVLVRSTAILAVLIFPMGVGLGVVADTLVAVILPRNWQDTAPYLMVLAGMSVFRPLSWVVDSYLKVTDRTRPLFLSELVKVLFLFSAIFLAPGAVWAALGVGLAFGLQSLVLIGLLAVLDRVSPLRFLPGFVGPLAACGIMAGAVLGVRYGLMAVGLEIMWLRLLIEILVGAVVYVPAAFLCAPTITRDVLGLLRKSFGRGQ
jgi:lipopolysaccharide exporter